MSSRLGPSRGVLAGAALHVLKAMAYCDMFHGQHTSQAKGTFQLSRVQGATLTFCLIHIKHRFLAAAGWTHIFMQASAHPSPTPTWATCPASDLKKAVGRTME